MSDAVSNVVTFVMLPSTRLHETRDESEREGFLQQVFPREHLLFTCLVAMSNSSTSSIII